MDRRDFLKRLGLFPLILPFLKLEDELMLFIEPEQKLNVESMFCFSNPSPYFGPATIESFYKALDEMRANA